MVMGQSAATAAVHAIEEKAAVQTIDAAKFKARLLADKQVLDFESPPSAPRNEGIMKDKLPGVVVDDTEAEKEGFRSDSTAAAPFVGSGYAHDDNAEKGKQRAVFTAKLPAAGDYEVRLAYTALNNRATNVPVTVKQAAGEKTITVNQRKAPAIDGLWISLGTFTFDGKAGAVEISNKGTDGHVIIDAVQWLPVKK